jgi:hypothetical protein
MLRSLALLAMGVVLFCGCGPTAKPIPAEYRVIAKALRQELHESRDDFNVPVDNSDILGGIHGAILDLRSVKSEDADINYIAAQASEAVADAAARLERIASMPKPPPQLALFLESFLHGWNGDLVTPLVNGTDAEGKQQAIAREAQALVAAVEKVYATNQLLPKVAEKYAAPKTQNNGRIAVDVDESWSGPFDWISLCNTGEALEDCTILVELTGQTGEVQRNVHFIERWPKNTWMYGRYEAGGTAAGRPFGRTTVHKIGKAEVSIWSPRFSTTTIYQYSGNEKDKDYSRWCQNLKFTGRYQPYVKGFFSNTQRGVEFTMTGEPRIPKCRVDVVFRRGSKSKDCHWEFDQWLQGEKKTFTPQTSGVLTFDPDTVDLTISFPGDSASKHAVTLKVP